MSTGKLIQLVLLSLAMITAKAVATPTDFTGDGKLDAVDLAYFKQVFFTDDAIADLNEDGVVNFSDLAMLRSAFGYSDAYATGDPNAGGDVFIALLPATETVEIGEVFSLDVFIDFTNDPTVGGGMDIAYDPAILGSPMWTFETDTTGADPGFQRQPDISPGLLSGLASGDFNGLTTGIIGTVSFEALPTAGTEVTDVVGFDNPGPIPGGWISANTFGQQFPQYSPSSVTVVGNPTPLISIVPPVVGFPRTLPGDTSQIDVIISNMGFEDLILGEIAIGDALDPPFFIIADTCSLQTLATTVSCTVSVQFAPTSGLISADSFDVPSNDPDTPSTVVPVSGDSTDPVATFGIRGAIQGCGGTCQAYDALDAETQVLGYISFDPASLVDGNWTGADITEVSLILLNPALPFGDPGAPPDQTTDNPLALNQSPDGGAIVVANGQDITNPRGTFPSRQSMGTTDGQTIPSGFIDLWVTQGALADEGVVITLGGENRSFELYTSEGQDLFAAGSTFGFFEPVMIAAAPPVIAFPTTSTGEQAQADILVASIGEENLDITAVSLIGGDPFSVLDDGCTAQSLATGETCLLTVGFAPTLDDVYLDELVIESNDSSDAVLTIALGGVGQSPQPPDIILDPATLDFGPVRSGQTVEVDIIATNNGDEDLVIGAIGDLDLLDPPFSIAFEDCLAQPVPGGDSCTIRVAYAPDAIGTASDSFDIATNDPGQASLTVTVEGRGARRIALLLDGIAPVQGSCNNITTGNSITVPLTGEFSINCETSGIDIAPGDRVRVTAVGPAPGILFVGGGVSGLAQVRVACRNQTTGQIIGFAPTPGAPSWDCKARGLGISPGDGVLMIVTGNAF